MTGYGCVWCAKILILFTIITYYDLYMHLLFLIFFWLHIYVYTNLALVRIWFAESPFIGPGWSEIRPPASSRLRENKLRMWDFSILGVQHGPRRLYRALVFELCALGRLRCTNQCKTWTQGVLEVVSIVGSDDNDWYVSSVYSLAHGISRWF